MKLQKKDYSRNDNRLVEWHRLSGATVFLDWAGGRDRVDDCFAAAVLVLWEPMMAGERAKDTGITHPLAKTHCYVLAVWMDKIKLTDQVRAIFELIDEHLPVIMKHVDLRILCAIEDVVRDNTGTIKESVEEAYKEARKEFPGFEQQAFTFHPRHSGKVDRIAAMEPAITHGWLAFNHRLEAEFMKQMRQFPNADFNDGPDALQGATELPVHRTVVERRTERERRKYYEKKRRMFTPYGD